MKYRVLSACAAALVVAGLVVTSASTQAAAPTGLDLSAANRRAPLSGLPDWRGAGYRGGQNLPGESDHTTNAACRITPEELAGFAVKPNDGVDDTTGLQKAIDAIRTGCSASASYTKLSLITLPAGTLNVSREIFVDADYLTVRGAGAATKVVYKPDANTRYDTLTPDGSDWDEDGMTAA